MESSNKSSGFSTFAYTNGKNPASFYPFVSDSSSYIDSLPVASRGKQRTDEVAGKNYQRSLSDNLLMEEEPLWLEDLLSEPVTMAHICHRRSASDSYAYLGAAAEKLHANKERDLNDLTARAPFDVSTFVYSKDLNQVSSDTTPNSSDETIHKASYEPNGGGPLSSEKHNKEEPNMQNTESSSEKANGPQQKSFMSKTETKRAKQQSAHRSRVRKLQHIAELERTVQFMQVEESAMSSELEFLDQQNLILSMENRALRQRLESLSQEFLIKRMEQEMLERELGRLQAMYQLQRQQPVPQQPSLHRQSNSRDLLEAQFANLSLKNNEVSSGRAAGSVSRSVRIP
nr:Basic leucine zipper 34 [Ipomoea batatas]GMD53065.1 Basic leucine zipper 34 [Ipomoea batatas]